MSIRDEAYQRGFEDGRLLGDARRVVVAVTQALSEHTSSSSGVYQGAEYNAGWNDAVAVVFSVLAPEDNA